MNKHPENEAPRSAPLDPAQPVNGAGPGRRLAALTHRGAHRALWYEVWMWRSLARWVAHRPNVPADGTAFAYRAPQMLVTVVILVLSAGEVVALHLLLPWPALRTGLLAVGFWGVAWGFGMIGAITVHPHVVQTSGLRVRSALGCDVHVPWDAVGTVRRALSSHGGGSCQLDGTTLYVPVAGQCTVEVVLRRPLDVALPHRRSARIAELRFHADDADGLVAAVRARALAAGARAEG